MGQISDIQNPWRERLLSQQASFRGVMFHVETVSRVSGRRTVVHEYPKRNEPYSEDMGRHARRFTISGYLIYRPSNPLYEYVSQRDALVDALENDESGLLVHPVYAPGGMQVMCERYSVTETRERGGFTQFEMSFVEEGKPGNWENTVDTASKVDSNAAAAEQAATDAVSTDALSAYEAGSQPIVPNAPAFQPNNAEQQVINSGITY